MNQKSPLTISIADRIEAGERVADVAALLGVKRERVYRAIQACGIRVMTGARMKRFNGYIGMKVRGENRVCAVPMTALRAAGLHECYSLAYRVKDGEIILSRVKTNGVTTGNHLV